MVNRTRSVCSIQRSRERRRWQSATAPQGKPLAGAAAEPQPSRLWRDSEGVAPSEQARDGALGGRDLSRCCRRASQQYALDAAAGAVDRASLDPGR